jgi:hypothetical protein
MSMDIGKKMRTDWINLDKKVENKNKSKRTSWERWLITTTESKQKQTKTKREKTQKTCDTKKRINIIKNSAIK